MAYKIKGDVDISRGLGLASMTSVQRIAYTTASVGYTVYDSTLHSIYTWDGTNWLSGKDRVLADNTTVAPAVTGNPTLAEIVTFVSAGVITDTLVYYTGDDLVVSTPTHVYSVDASGNVTLLNSPSSGGIVVWAASTFYSAGTTVTTPSGALVNRIASGTSGTAYNVAEAGAWVLVQNGPLLVTFTASMYIYAGQELFDAASGDIYKRSTSGLTLGTFILDAANWGLISETNTNVTNWTATTAYDLGQSVITSGGSLVIANADFTSGATFNGVEAAKWTALGQVKVSAFAGTTYYYVGDKAYNGTVEMIRGVAGVSPSTLTILEAGNWTYNSQALVGSYAASTVTLAGELMSNGGVIYQRIANGTSGATFNSVEKALWLALTGTVKFEQLIANATTAWGTAAGGLYTITTTLATHGVTVPKEVDVYETVAGVNTKVYPDAVSILANGDVVVSVSDVPDGRFIGRIEIK